MLGFKLNHISKRGHRMLFGTDPLVWTHDVLNHFQRKHKIYSKFLFFLITELAHVADTLPDGRQGPTYLTANTTAADELAL